MTPRAFYEALFADCAGQIELRALPGKARTYAPVDDRAELARFVKVHARENLYHGVATRKDATSGGAENCLHLGALFGDIDGKATDLEAAHARLMAAPCPPSAVIDSGGGLHAYWFLREPLDVQTTDPKPYLRRLVAAFDGDRACVDVARILRVPGTKNFKPEYGTPRPVRLVALDAARRYNLADLDEVLPADPELEATRPTGEAEGPLADVKAAGRYLRQTAPGKFAIVCPWQHEHTTESNGADTMLFAPTTPGGGWGFRCQHTHCTGRGIGDLYRWLRTTTRGRDTSEKSDQSPPASDLRSHISHMSPASGWPELAPAAFVGLPGELVRVVGPSTEADPAALLVVALAMAGSAIGRGPRFDVGADPHHTNLFAVLVGPTATGRKGTAHSAVRQVFAAADEAWARDCTINGLSSGEGLIHAVRDALELQEPVKERGRVVDYQTVVKDPGVSDKRLFVTEAEFASVLRVGRRDGSTLSPTLRMAWDTGDLRVMTKQSPERATGAHITIVGHITPEELVREMSGTDLANGLANRFLFVASRRSRVLPFGGRVDPMALGGLTRAFEHALATARTCGQLTWDRESARRWAQVFEALTSERPGLAGAVVARGAPQVIRLAMIYALLDARCTIGRVHLEAALAVWDYCMATATMVFGARVGDQLADYLVTLIRESGEAGVTRTEIRDALGRHKSADEIDAALGVLLRYGLADRRMEATKGRPVERWRAVRFTRPTEDAPTPTPTTTPDDDWGGADE